MARPESQKIKEARARLIARLQAGLHRPGERFMSNRIAARQLGISYQTAHRLVQELCAAGLLVRRTGAGTYVPGKSCELRAVQLLFHRRARRKESFGARLFNMLIARLDRDGIEWHVSWVADGQETLQKIRADRFPIIWECPGALAQCEAAHRRALVLNDRPQSGLSAVYIDSVSTDDFSGGACAAEILSRRNGRGTLAVLAGPADDKRSRDRVAGFVSRVQAKVISAGGWYFEDGLIAAARAVSAGPGGVFCCNDRLAEGVVTWCRSNRVTLPPICGFDDAAVSERLGLSTIAVPWAEIVNGAATVARRRLAGDVAVASGQIFAPRPIIRESSTTSALGMPASSRQAAGTAALPATAHK